MSMKGAAKTPAVRHNHTGSFLQKDPARRWQTSPGLPRNPDTPGDGFGGGSDSGSSPIRRFR